MAPCERSWAGRVVILLQLVSWCAVGALLLHRGISSVKHEDPSPSTPEYDTMQRNLTKPTVTNSTELEKSTSLKSKLAEQSTVLKIHLEPKQRLSGNSLEKQESSWAESALDVAEGSGENETEAEEGQTPSSHKTPFVRHNVRVASASRKNLILTPSGVVMAALGAIMLILGPSIVILKCCEAGSRGRFSKLYGQDPALALSALDRPPAYEEVAENAPRYSTLFPEDEEITEDTPVTVTVTATATNNT